MRILFETSSCFRAKDNLGKLSSYLSGQFCASINLISPTETVNPKVAFQPFLSNISRTHRDHHRHGYVALLPQEAICTENLTPWTKLLPCRSRKGLGSLLVATNIFNSLFISLSLDFRYSCLVSNFTSQLGGHYKLTNFVSLFRTSATVPPRLELS